MLNLLRKADAAWSELAARSLHHRTASHWFDLISAARGHVRVKPLDDVHYGEAHWRATAAIGLALCAGTTVDPRIVLAFAILHDSQRSDRLHDADHGHRAADEASRSPALAKLLAPRDVVRVMDACAGHSDGMVTDDPVLGICWDSDRLAMLQRGRQPHVAYMSTPRCRTDFGDVREMAQAICAAPPRWPSLVAACAATQGTGPRAARRPRSLMSRATGF